MWDVSASGNAYNRLDHLDGIEDRIIYYLISPTNKNPQELKQVHDIWKILYYNDVDALNKPLPSYRDITKLIYNDNGTQTGFRIFRSPRLEDSWAEECSLLKIYVDSILPTNHLVSLVNVGIDIVVSSSIINLAVAKDESIAPIDEVDGIPVYVQTKSRVTALAQAVISLLNGAEVQGVGKLVFSRKQSIYNQGQYGLWNNRSFEGMKVVLGVTMGSMDMYG